MFSGRRRPLLGRWDGGGGSRLGWGDVALEASGLKRSDVVLEEVFEGGFGGDKVAWGGKKGRIKEGEGPGGGLSSLADGNEGTGGRKERQITYLHRVSVDAKGAKEAVSGIQRRVGNLPANTLTSTRLS